MDKTYKPSTASHIKSIAVRAAAILIVLALVSVVVAGDFTMAASLFNLVLVGCIIYEVSATTVITVRMDGVVIKKGSNRRELRYETFYFDTAGHAKLTAEDRRTSRTETFACRGFEKKQYDEMLAVIKRTQREFFQRRSANGDFRSGAAIKPEARQEPKPAAAAPAAAPSAERAARAAAEASRRNPYSKNFEGQKPEPAPAPAVQSEPVKAETAPVKEPPAVKPAAPPAPPSVKVEIKADKTVIESVTKSFEKEIPADYNKIPEIAKFDDTAYRTLPEIRVKEPEPRPVPVPDETFTKLEFRYPRRQIQEKCEHENALTVLWAMFAAVAAFLLWYLIAGVYTGGAVMTGVVIAGIAAVTGLILVQSRSAKARGIFSKLEITEKYLIIDNTRYRYLKITSGTVTAPDREGGIRRISFNWDGKRVTYSMGPARLGADKRDVHVFPRYTELCRALQEKGFELC